MKHLFLALLMSAFCYASHGQINMPDSLVQVITYWDKGEYFDYTVTHEKFLITGADTLRRSMVEYDVTLEVIDSLETGYTMRWSYSSPGFEGVDTETGGELDIIYMIDELGAFLEVVNMDQIAGFTGRILENISSGRDEKEVSVLRALAEDITRTEFIEQFLLKDIQLFHFFHGGVYELGETYEDIVEVSTVGGIPVNAYIHVYLDEIYEEDDDYVMVCYQEIDGEQLMEASFDYLDRIASAAGGERLDRTQLSVKMSNETVTVSQIHDSGWVINGKRTETVKAENSISVEIRSIEMKFTD